MFVLRRCGEHAFVGTSVEMIAAARTAALERGTCLPSLLVSTVSCPFDGVENTCSSCVCGFLHGEDSSSQDGSIAALNLLVVVACVYRFQPYVMCFQPFVLLALCVASSISRRQRTCVKCVGKDCKGEKEPICFQAGKIEAQASSLIQAESLIALESAELEEREESIDISWDDVRNAVVAECPEYQFEAAAAFGACRSPPEKLEAVQSGQNIQFFIKGVIGTQTRVVREGSHVALGLVAGVMGMDVYAMVGGRIVNHSLSLESLGITSNCTVSFFSRLRGGSRENVPWQWTCSNCLAERCWPVRTTCCRCGAPRQADSALGNDKKGKGPKGPLGRAPPRGPSSVPPTTSTRPHVVPPRWTPPGAGVGKSPPPTPLNANRSTEFGQVTQAPPRCQDQRGLL